ncbi:MAG TPA: hypothetical protein VGE02_12230 [Gemmatimonadales bacterium]
MALWDKLKTELDRAGRAAQTAFDEGKVRLELLRLRQLADKAAQALGYAVHNARRAGGELDQESYARLSSTLAAHEAEISRLEAQLAAEREQAAQRPATAQATMHDQPAGTDTAGASGSSTSGGSSAGTQGGHSSGTPPFSRPVSSNPGGVDPAMGDTGHGGPPYTPGG